MKTYTSIGNIDITLVKNIFNDISTREIVLTNERQTHVLTHHNEDLILYGNCLKEIIKGPDYILKETKKENTIIMIKKINGENINLVIKLATKRDEIHTKNSIMTFYRIREKNLKKLITKNKIIFKRLDRSE